MAIRSLLLSLAVTAILGCSFTLGLTDPTSFLKKIPDWLGIPLMLGCGLLYLLAAWWAFRGFSEHKITALLSLSFCALGLGMYALGFTMELGKDKAATGQYAYDFGALDPAEKSVVAQLAQEAGLGLSHAVFTEHWHLADSSDGFRICVQQGHVTALNVSNHPVRDLTLLSQLPKLGDLYLKNCGLSDLNALRLSRLERLDVSNNQLRDLNTLRGCPNLRWLVASHNRLQSIEGIEHFKELISTDFRGNPMP